jgi:hypothetical protein
VFGKMKKLFKKSKKYLTKEKRGDKISRLASYGAGKIPRKIA